MTLPGHGPIRVFIADDHSIVRHGLTSYLAVTGDIDVAGEAGDGAEAGARGTALRAGGCGYVLKSASPEEIAQAVRAVSSGGLHLDAALSASLTEAVAPSGIPVSLTDREREVLALV